MPTNGLIDLTEEQKDKYERSWAESMVQFWQEKMMKFTPPIYDTGTLYKSLTSEIHPGPSTTITHHFMEYGIYVAAGVGNGYRRGNSGKDDENGLQFLRGKKWNKGRGHRQKRDWFSGKYRYSLYRLNDFENKYFGTAYMGMLCKELAEMYGNGIVMSDGHATRL